MRHPRRLAPPQYPRWLPHPAGFESILRIHPADCAAVGCCLVLTFSDCSTLRANMPILECSNSTTASERTRGRTRGASHREIDRLHHCPDLTARVSKRGRPQSLKLGPWEGLLYRMGLGTRPSKLKIQVGDSCPEAQCPAVQCSNFNSELCVKAHRRYSAAHSQVGPRPLRLSMGVVRRHLRGVTSRRLPEN